MENTPRLQWLLLLYQLPTHPSNLRVKVWRKLQKLGAVNVKSAAYVLPYNEMTEEDFQWLCQEIIDGGGDATIFIAYGLSVKEEEEIVRLFQEMRAKDYESFLSECQQKVEQIEELIQRNDHEAWEKYETEGQRLQSRLAEIEAIDFFNAPQKAEALAILKLFSDTLQKAKGVSAVTPPSDLPQLARSEYKDKIWVTRAGMHIDRLASAWLIRRFVDANARFDFVTASPTQSKEFVSDGGLPPSTGEKIPFDMYGAFFGHHGEDCTFETLLKHFGLTDDTALNELAQLIHDIDLKDDKFGRRAATGIDFVVRSLRQRWEDDQTLLEKGLDLFDALYDQLRS